MLLLGLNLTLGKLVCAYSITMAYAAWDRTSLPLVDDSVFSLILAFQFSDEGRFLLLDKCTNTGNLRSGVGLSRDPFCGNSFCQTHFPPRLRYRSTRSQQTVTSANHSSLGLWRQTHVPLNTGRSFYSRQVKLRQSYVL